MNLIFGETTYSILGNIPSFYFQPNCHWRICHFEYFLKEAQPVWANFKWGEIVCRSCKRTKVTWGKNKLDKS